MFILGTYLGLAMGVLMVWAVITTLRWQRRWGGFWIYSVLFALFLAVVALGTYTESRLLTPAALAQRLPDFAPEFTTVEELRPMMIARNNSLMLTMDGIFLAASMALMVATVAKARRSRAGGAGA